MSWCFRAGGAYRPGFGKLQHPCEKRPSAAQAIGRSGTAGETAPAASPVCASCCAIRSSRQI